MFEWLKKSCFQEITWTTAEEIGLEAPSIEKEHSIVNRIYLLINLFNNY